MKLHTAVLLSILLLSIDAQATEPNFEIGGVRISRGMSQESVRSQLAEPYRLQCPEAESGAEVVSCTISANDGSPGRLNILVQDGRVLTASQGYAVPPAAFDALLTLHKLLQQLTDGKDTCAVIRVSDGPPPQFSIALPEKYVAVFLHEHDQRQVSLDVGLRQNPTPSIQLRDCWPTIDSGVHKGEANSTSTDDSTASKSMAPPNYAMQRSALVVTPLAGTASGSHKFGSASGAPTARRR